MRKLYIVLQYPRVLLADILYCKAKKIQSHHNKNKTIAELLDEDMLKYNTKHSGIHKAGVSLLNYCLITQPIFRSNFYYRIGDSAMLASSLCRVISLILIKPLTNIEIGGKIDGGLHIIHKMGCVVVPEKAGKNLTVYQGGVIAFSNKVDEFGSNHSTLGDNVTMFSNSVIMGGVHIGSNCVIGAGSIVGKDIPDDCVVVGNPAVIIREKGEKVKKTL